MRTHEQMDQRSLALGCAVADKLERQPELLESARRNLERWIAAGGQTPLRAHTEWRDLLDRLPPPALLELLRSDTEEARRLRQSSPFAGLLAPAERWRILREYETPPA
jgi:hypothetical protein